MIKSVQDMKIEIEVIKNERWKTKKMNKEDEKILNNLINKKEEVLEFTEIKSIVKLLLDVNKKINKLLPTELKVENCTSKHTDESEKKGSNE